MANLAKLPPELLLRIAGCYSDNPPMSRTLNQKDLASLAGVNRRLHRVFNPILYDFNMKFKDSTASLIAVRRNNLDTLKVMKSLKVLRDWKLPFMCACVLERCEILEWLLDNTTFRPNGDENSRKAFITILRIAFVYRVSEDIIILLLSRTPVPDALRVGEHARTSALHYAAEANMLRVVDYLVQEMGLPVDTRDATSFSPLLYAMKCELTKPYTAYNSVEGGQVQEETVEENWPGEQEEPEDAYESHYTDEGEDESEAEDDGIHDTNPGLPLCPYNDVRMLNKLIELGADIDTEVNGMLPLTAALKFAKYHHALVLISAGAKIKPSQPGVPYPIHECVACPELNNPDFVISAPARERVLRRILEVGGDLEERYEQGYTPLEYAVLRGDPDIISLLLDMGASMRTETADGDSIMDFLVRNYYQINHAFNKMDVFHRSGARMDTPLKSIGMSLLMWLSQDTDLQTELEKLLMFATPSTLCRDHLDELFLRYLEVGLVDDSIYNIFVRYGAVLKDFDKAYSGILRSIRYSRFESCDESEIYWFGAVLDMGVPMEMLYDLFTCAMTRQDELKAHALLDRMEPDLSDQNREWLHQAVINKSWDIVQRLLRRGVNANALSELSRTPLAEAAEIGCDTAARILLGYGANPFLPQNRPIHINSEDNVDRQRIPGMSAFEIAICQDYTFEMAKEMWRMTAPDARPKLDEFILCVPPSCPNVAKWLRQVNGDIDVKGKGKAIKGKDRNVQDKAY
ncbi:ankyrin [Hypoxylon sp. FL0890]|nr:ankyrin [Hypoxylon sp. FL0890]